MKILDMYNELLNLDLPNSEGKTCDTIKSGNPNDEIKNIGVSMFATVAVIKECIKKNINFLIVHEPVYYNHYDDCLPNKFAREKQKLIEKSNITILRYHDHPHSIKPDMIYKGQIALMDIPGKMEIGKQFGINRYILDEPVTALDLARYLENKLNIKHIKVAGCIDRPGKIISCCFGTPGHIIEELENNDFVLTGELCEWGDAETVRDCAQMGYNKAVLVMGHIGSEKGGMMLLSRVISQIHPEIHAEYIECGEVYSY